MPPWCNHSRPSHQHVLLAEHQQGEELRHLGARPAGGAPLTGGSCATPTCAAAGSGGSPRCPGSSRAGGSVAAPARRSRWPQGCRLCCRDRWETGVGLGPVTPTPRMGRLVPEDPLNGLPVLWPRLRPLPISPEHLGRPVPSFLAFSTWPAATKEVFLKWHWAQQGQSHLQVTLCW